MKRKKEARAAAVTQLRSGSEHPFGMLTEVVPMGGVSAEVYRQMRQAIPILDAAVGKLVRLTGGFRVECGDKGAEAGLKEFLRTVPVGYGQIGIDNFLAAYLDSMLTYGRAIGEMVIGGKTLQAVCWGDVTKIHVQEGEGPLDYVLGVWENGKFRALPYPHLLLFSTWNPDAANPYGTSLFRGMPFLADILLKIYNTIGVNWERAGNVRYSVVCKPGAEDGRSAQEVSDQMAKHWAAAMQDAKHGVVRDFVAVGDVEIKVIGADGQILDSEVPVRQILEQLVAKTGLPPFLLGLSWASTERMSAQQTDLLTAELWSIRRCVQPVLERICRMWLALNGYGCVPEIVWDDISLQDIVEGAHAALYQAQADKINWEMEQ